MSTIAPDDVAQVPGNRVGRWLSGVFTIGLLLAAALAVYLEPYYLLDRVRDAVRADDAKKQRALVDPGLIGPDLAAYLDASRPGPGRTIDRRYATPSRFLVIVRPEHPGPDSATAGDPGRVLTLVIERRGLAWWLAEIVGPEPWALDGIFGRAPGVTRGEPRRDSLPGFGAYVQVDELPQPVSRVNPVYPSDARAAGIEGTVMVRALVDAEGLVKEVRADEGAPSLVAAALESVRQWRFEPARSGGRPVAVWVTIPVRFTLH